MGHAQGRHQGQLLRAIQVTLKGHLLNGQLLQKMLPEKPRAPLFQYLLPFGDKSPMGRRDVAVCGL